MVQIFWKVIEGGDQDFHVKMDSCLLKGGKQCLSLIMYGFCNGDTLYSENLSIKLFIFLLTSFDT